MIYIICTDIYVSKSYMTWVQVMIMGDTCTRGCRFCSVATSRSPAAVDPAEPQKVAEAVSRWNVDYIVLTMAFRSRFCSKTPLFPHFFDRFLSGS